MKINLQNSYIPTFGPPKSEKRNEEVFTSKNTYSKCDSTAVGSFNKYLVNFTGLNRNLGKLAFNYTKDIKKESEFFSKSQGIVGNLPSEWIEKIPKAERALKIKEFYQSMKTGITLLKNKQPEEALETLNCGFKKAGIIPEEQQFHLCKLDSGYFGTAYQMKGVSNDSLVLKVYNSFPNDSEIHGQYAEVNRAAYWQKAEGKETQIVRFYFGDVDTGYMTTKFIDEDAPAPKKVVLPAVHGLHSDDVTTEDGINGHNLKNGHQIDWGGLFIKNPRLVRDKKSTSTIKKILAASQSEQAEMIKIADKKVKIGLADCLEYVDKEQSLLLFEELAKNADNELKLALYKNNDILNFSKKMEYFKKFAVGADNKLKMSLANNLPDLSNEERNSYFKQFAQNSDDGLKTKLTNYFRICLEEDERVEYFNQFAQGGSNKLKASLAGCIGCLPVKKQAESLKLLSQGADKNLKGQLPYYLRFIPIEERMDVFRLFAKDADEDVKITLTLNLNSIPKENRAECFGILAKDAGWEVKSKLRYMIDTLPSEKQAECAKLVE